MRMMNRAKLNAAIAEACDELEFLEEAVDAYDGIPKLGDLFVFPIQDDVAIEWLLVRFLPGDEEIALFVPIDQDLWVGSADVDFRFLIPGRYKVRCGESDWLPVSLCAIGAYVGKVPEEALRFVRQKLAALARGVVVGTPESRRVDFDPEYEELMYKVRQARACLADVK